MKNVAKGMFARSLAGHDKGRLYIILCTDEEYVYLADGKNRLLDTPKKKRKRHVQVDYHISALIQDRMDSRCGLRDEDIKRAIKLKEANI
ncbi:KOW domain-containing RNA-binding protein [Ruminococcus sp. OA3]|uniref:KOW domain-containing RNA-binding protein n=1 Tax=Ruminococcus sp. OA3 TaxID=2914164 RepID=UPI001F062E0D|nr:KOW domain-containing RNA-binding protein [Ruminococcus sp. OA3]MCH1984241.1 KOW domain-containing RNA-binding protein [Ruminococcus sp. OA3]